MATTYTTLLAEVASYLSRADLTSTIPTFVQLAQARINRDVRCREMITKSASFSITGEYVNLPSDFLEVKHFYLNASPRKTLAALDAEGMTDLYPSSDSEPRYFSVEGAQFRFSPAPSATVTATLIYYAKPVTLATTTAETNVLFPTVAPDLYLYASLLEAESFIQNDPRLAVWAEAYQRGVEALNSSARGSRHGGPLMTRAG
jgi:hypothetical protein